jgi:hypothetical protein
MQEIRLYGSEGGVVEKPAIPTPIRDDDPPTNTPEHVGDAIRDGAN